MYLSTEAALGSRHGADIIVNTYWVCSVMGEGQRTVFAFKTVVKGQTQ